MEINEAREEAIVVKITYLKCSKCKSDIYLCADCMEHLEFDETIYCSAFNHICSKCAAKLTNDKKYGIM